MDCRTTTVYKFRARLRFKQYDVILTKKQSMLKKTKSSFEAKNVKTRYCLLGYRIDLYFHDYRLAIEIDENGHSDKNIDYEIRRQKTIEDELCSEFIKTGPDKEKFDAFKAINEIFRFIKQSNDQLTKYSTKKV